MAMTPGVAAPGTVQPPARSVTTSTNRYHRETVKVALVHRDARNQHEGVFTRGYFATSYGE